MARRAGSGQYGVMTDALVANEAGVRLALFLSILTVLALVEVLSPRRTPAFGRARRWPANLGIVALDAIVLRIVLPVAAVGAALMTEASGIGLFHLLGVPWWIALPLAVLLLDLSVWAQHVATHRIPLLWRLHRMHHADLDFDVTTGLRFHPIEIVLSMVWKIAVVVALGARRRRSWSSKCCSTPAACSATPTCACPRASTRCCAGSSSRRTCTGPPFDRTGGDAFELRLLLFLVGPAVRHLSRRAARRPRRHDHRTAGVPRPRGTEARPDADAAVPRARRAVRQKEGAPLARCAPSTGYRRAPQPIPRFPSGTVTAPGEEGTAARSMDRLYRRGAASTLTCVKPTRPATTSFGPRLSSQPPGGSRVVRP